VTGRTLGLGDPGALLVRTPVVFPLHHSSGVSHVRRGTLPGLGALACQNYLRMHHLEGAETMIPGVVS